jgi:hypothetical protein
MPVFFLGLIFYRAGERPLAVHFQSCDYLRDGTRRDGYLRTIEVIAHRIKNFTVHIAASSSQWHLEATHLPRLFATPFPNLESLDLSYNAFYASSPSTRSQYLYRPVVNDESGGAVVPHLIASIPTAWQLKHLTLRHMRGWPPALLRNLTYLTLFGYADGVALAEAVSANPALLKLRLESIKYEERYSYDPDRLVNLDGQTLELARCERGVLSMFTLSSTCSLVITRTMDQRTTTHAWGVWPTIRWLPEDISKIRCLHELEGLHFSVNKVPGRGGWVTAEQKTVGYPIPNPASGSGHDPSVTFVLTYHYDAKTPLHEVSLVSRYLLPSPTPWGKVTCASFDGFCDQFKICNNVVLKTLPNLRSLTLRRCASDSLVHFIAPNELQGLESLRFEDGLSEAELGDTLAGVLEIRHIQSASAGLRLRDLEVVTSGEPSSIITVEQRERLEECVCRVEITRAPGYRHVLMAKYN